MDDTDSYISFDSKGICDHCNTFKLKIEPFWKNDNSNINYILNLSKKIKSENSNKDFDCIIGMSGGIDSSYLVYITKEILNLRPLVFHVDAGWNSQQAVNNIENIVDKLNLDLFTEVIDWSEMRDLQLAFFKSSVPHIDTPQDHAFFATMYKFAVKHKIKYIFTGGNYSTECIRNPIEWMYYQSDSIQLLDIHKKFGEKSLKKFPITNILWHKVYLPYFLGIKLIRPLDYIEYKKIEAIEYLEKNLNFQKYNQKHFESRFTKFYESYWLPNKFGFDTRKVQYSSLILTKQMKREQALKQLSDLPYDKDYIKNDLEFISNKLDIKTSKLNEYFNLPNKSYKDYKNMQLLYNIGSKAMKFLGMERGGKR